MSFRYKKKILKMFFGRRQEKVTRGTLKFKFNPPKDIYTPLKNPFSVSDFFFVFQLFVEI